MAGEVANEPNWAWDGTALTDRQGHLVWAQSTTGSYEQDVCRACVHACVCVRACMCVCV